MLYPVYVADNGDVRLPEPGERLHGVLVVPVVRPIEVCPPGEARDPEFLEHGPGTDRVLYRLQQMEAPGGLTPDEVLQAAKGLVR